MISVMHVHACDSSIKTGHGFLTSYVAVLFVFNGLRRDVVVHFVDIEGIVDHHLFNRGPIVLTII